MAKRFVLPFADIGPGLSVPSGALLYFFDTGTSNKRNTYTTSAATTNNANPVVADSRGVFSDIFIEGDYKVILKDMDGVQKWEADPVSSDESLELFSSNYTTLDLAAAAAVGKELVINDVKTVSSNTTYSGFSIRFVLGGRIDPDTAITATLNLTVTAPPIKIFGGAGLIAGDFSGNSLLLEWWGAVGDGTLGASTGNDDTAAINACCVAAKPSRLGFKPMSKIYRHTAQLFFDHVGNVRGSHRESCIFLKDGDFAGIRIYDSEGAEYSGFTSRGNVVTRSDTATNGDDGIIIDRGSRIHFHDIASDYHGDDGIWLQGGNLAIYNNIRCHQNFDDGFVHDSFAGTDPAVSANGCVMMNFDVRGNGGIGYNLLYGVANRLIMISAQSNVGAGMTISSNSRSNMTTLYEESNSGTSELLSGSTGNYVEMIQGAITDSGSNNSVFTYNQSGTNKFGWYQMHARKITMEDRWTGTGNNSLWSVQERGDTTSPRLMITDDHTNAKSGLIDINKPAGNSIDVKLTGYLKAYQGLFCNTALALESGVSDPAIAGCINYFTNGATTGISSFEGGEIGMEINIICTQANMVVSQSPPSFNLDVAGAMTMTPTDSITLKAWFTLIPYETETGAFTAGLVVTGATSGAQGTIQVLKDDGNSGTLSLSGLERLKTLAYDDETGTFTSGLKVTGTTSGAFGTISNLIDSGVAGILTLSDVSGVFIDNEAITDSSTGIAVVDGIAAPAAFTDTEAITDTSTGVAVVNSAAVLGYAWFETTRSVGA